jgi:phytoene synthase
MSHNQREIFDAVAFESSKIVATRYSTSFSSGIRLLHQKLRNPVYAIYGFVRYADEIVDTLHEHNRGELLARFRLDTETALREGISMNPILQSFQITCARYNISYDLIDTFLKSMEMDLNEVKYDRSSFDQYILGSAEVVGLMCLRVFTDGDDTNYEKLKPYAMSLGAGFQKINFLRDLKADVEGLGRMYFPDLNFQRLTDEDKKRIELEIESDFTHAYHGIKMLPKEARLGVFVAFVYYKRLFLKIRALPSHRIMEERIRIPNNQKLALVMKCYIKSNLNML